MIETLNDRDDRGKNMATSMDSYSSSFKGILGDIGRAFPEYVPFFQELESYDRSEEAMWLWREKKCIGDVPKLKDIPALPPKQY